MDVLTKLPPAPAYLDAVGKKVWKVTGRILVDRRTLTAGDLPTLGSYSEAESEFIAAVNAITEAKANGGLAAAIAAGLLKARDRADARVHRAGRELGLTPASRDRVPAAPGGEQEPDELEQFFQETHGHPRGRVATRKRG